MRALNSEGPGDRQVRNAKRPSYKTMDVLARVVELHTGMCDSEKQCACRSSAAYRL